MIRSEISSQRAPKVFTDLQLFHPLEVTISEAPADLILGDSTVTIFIKYVERHPEMLIIQQIALGDGAGAELLIAHLPIVVLIHDGKEFAPVDLTTHD